MATWQWAGIEYIAKAPGTITATCSDSIRTAGQSGQVPLHFSTAAAYQILSISLPVSYPVPLSTVLDTIRSALHE
jgi:hypothetical protein